jgi:hypothetical protein
MRYDARVRITFSPDADISRRLRDRAEAQGVSLSQLVNGLLREALEGGSFVREAAARYNAPRHQTHPMGLRPGLDPLRMKDYLAELDDEAGAAKLPGGGR